MSPKTVKDVPYKKHNHVYAVVGAACCNSTFRRKLFDAYDPNDVEPLRAVVNKFLKDTLKGCNPPHECTTISDRDLAAIDTFVAPRVIKLRDKRKKVLKALYVQPNAGPTAQTTFEVECENFSRAVCPHWPCDDN